MIKDISFNFRNSGKSNVRIMDKGTAKEDNQFQKAAKFIACFDASFWFTFCLIRACVIFAGVGFKVRKIPNTILLSKSIHFEIVRFLK